MTTSTFVFDGPDFNGPVNPLPSPNPAFNGPDFNAPVDPLPFARVVVDSPTYSDPYVDLYDGTNDAEIFEVQTPYRNGKFDSPDKQAVVNAGGGDDIVNGSNATDVIAGGAGKDELYGNAGNDWLTGGSGNDTISLQNLDNALATIAGGGAGKLEDFHKVFLSDLSRHFFHTLLSTFLILSYLSKEQPLIL